MLNLKTTLNFSEKLAIKLGKYILDNRSRIKVVEQKDLVDICTNIDKEVEQIAIDAISIKFPGHNIISEEIGEISRNSDYTWYLDPIDGTKEFLRDIPAYNTTFSLEYKNEIILGVTYQPFSKALFSGAINTGAFKNKQIIKVNQQDKLNES